MLQLIMTFAMLSLLAVGGANSTMLEIHRQSVVVHQWLTDAEFTTLFALTQAAPGPNVLIVSLIGWKVAGLTGGVVTTLAMCGPSSVLAFAVARLSDRFRDSPWRRWIQRGLAPVAVGMVLGSAGLLVQMTGVNSMCWLVAGVSTAIFLCTRLHPLWVLACAGALNLWLGA
ncbi:chromate transporter [Chitinivorax tropicus]|uniref:Chromate transporter n=1 Tax=Chitinivorax tropicus TaxID=714531 RepID=A0A840MV91_9PROT|nr:chromate transporter [Chitinivorax tropicus]MBB5019091.1 chromate transporter [Chitinivorax tropicus]